MKPFLLLVLISTAFAEKVTPLIPSGPQHKDQYSKPYPGWPITVEH